jgi:hypothetical protein
MMLVGEDIYPLGVTIGRGDMVEAWTVRYARLIIDDEE